MTSRVLALFLLQVLVAACATLKTDVIDKSGGPIRNVVVSVDYQDMPATKKLSTPNLTEALGRAVLDELRAISNGAIVAVVDSGAGNRASASDYRRRWPNATHVLRIDAALVSYSSHTPGRWTPCATKDKDKKCQPGMVGESTTSAQARVEGYLMELKTQRMVVHIDALNSPLMPVNDHTPMAAAVPLAKQFSRILEESGLVGKENQSAK